MVVNSSHAFALEKYIISQENSNKKSTFLKCLPFQKTIQNLDAGFFLWFNLFSNPANQFWSKHVNLST